MLFTAFPILAGINILTVFLRMLLSVMLGGVVGMGRQSKGRAAGLRTHILVCMGATLVMMTGQYVYTLFQTGDPARLGAQVVSGIGFLGVGTIMVTGEKKEVKGLTTAAGLWASAAMGLALGVGFYEAAIFACIIIYVVEKLMKQAETARRGTDTSYDLRIYAELENSASINSFLGFVTEQNWHTTDLDFVKKETENSPTVSITVMLHLEKETAENEVLEALRAQSFIKSIYEIS